MVRCQYCGDDLSGHDLTARDPARQEQTFLCSCVQNIWTVDWKCIRDGVAGCWPAKSRAAIDVSRRDAIAFQDAKLTYLLGPIRRVTEPPHSFPGACERCKQWQCICPKAVHAKDDEIVIRTDIVVNGSADPSRIGRLIREQLMAAAGVIALEPGEDVKMVEVPAKASEVVLGGMLTQSQLARAIFDHGLNAEAAKLAEVPSLKALRRILDIMWGTPEKPGTKSERRRECWALATAYLVAARQREEAGKP